MAATSYDNMLYEKMSTEEKIARYRWLTTPCHSCGRKQLNGEVAIWCCSRCDRYYCSDCFDDHHKKEETNMEEEIKKQEEELAKEQAKATAPAAHSGMLGIVLALNRLTRSTLLVARAIDCAARDRWDRDNLMDERGAR